MKKLPPKMELPENLTLKLMENAMRIFEDKVSKPQLKCLKTVVRWIMRNATTVLARLYESDEMETYKFIEKQSKHLGNMEILDVIQKKAIKIVKDHVKEWPIFISYDESDIFKPDAKKMPWLTRIRDWSTGLTGNWYVFRWVNVNGISLLSQLDVVSKQEEKENQTKTTKTLEIFKQMRKMIPEIMSRNDAYVLYDRWWDCIDVIDDLIEYWNKMIIRMKKVRKLKCLATNKTMKITEFWLGKHYVEIEWWTRVYLHVVKKKENKEPILLITNDETLDSKTVLEYYLKRWKIEEDFNKMKDLWLEDVRLMSMKKIQNLIAIIQFIIILSQDVFNEVMSRKDPVNENIYLYYAKFCKRKSLTHNPQSFIKFISYSLVTYNSYNTSQEPLDTLFWNRRKMKKLGII
jgi:hypothetical protein